MTQIGIGSPEWIAKLKDAASQVAGMLTQLSHQGRTTPLISFLVLEAIGGQFLNAAQAIPPAQLAQLRKMLHPAVSWEVPTPEARAKARAAADHPARYAVVFFRQGMEKVGNAAIVLREEAYGKGGIPWAWLFADLEAARAHAEDGGPADAHGRIYEAIP